MTEPAHAIAVIGLSCRLPGARDPDELWRNLVAGRDSITRYPPEALLAAGVAPEELQHPHFVAARGTIDEIEVFDYEAFGLSRAEALRMDPQHRVFLEEATRALDAAALDPSRFRGWIGVFGGCDAYGYGAAEHDDVVARLLASEKDFLCTRVSHALRLSGPSLTVQTACSTSLVAVHLACQSLLAYECDAALAGGVALQLPQVGGYLYREGHILARDGRCRAFDAEASGTVASSGAALVVLRRLEDALRDGDPIAAIILGSAINNDGGDKVAFTAPSVQGQRDVIRLALSAAAVPAESIGYVEAHGTGTRLGDPVEVAALCAAYGERERHRRCALGSIKSNLGHTGAAAGAAGLLKAVSMVERGYLVPSLHFSRPNPDIPFAESPFEVCTSTAPWPEAAWPRRAGVSSFGMGGTNAHVVIEQPPAVAAASRRPQRPRLLAVSARSAPTLARARGALADWVEANPEAPLDELEATLGAGRRELPWRCAIVGGDGAAAAEALRRAPALGSPAASPPRVAFVFPGQGTLRPGSGRELYASWPAFREALDHARALTRPTLGLDFGALLLGEQGPPERLLETEVQQVALFGVCWALTQQLEACGLRPSAMLGNSLGELVAATVAGLWSPEQAFELVARRGQLMQRMAEGRLLAVRLPQAELADLLAGASELELAALTPEGGTIGGPAAAIEALARHLTARGVANAAIDTRRAFHTAAVEPIAPELRTAFQACAPRDLATPLVSNVTGDWLRADLAAHPDYWLEHARRPVQLARGFGTLLADHTVLVQVGPGHSMLHLARRHPRWTADHVALSTMSLEADGKGEPAHESTALLTVAARLWERGHALRWETLLEPAAPRRRLPATPLERRPCWRTAAGERRAASGLEQRLGAGFTARPPALASQPALQQQLDALCGELAFDLIRRRSRLRLGDELAHDELMARLDPQRRLPRMMELLLAWARADGALVMRGDRWTLAPRAPHGPHVATSDEAALAGLLRLLRHCAAHYDAVLDGDTDALAVLYPDGSDRLLRECAADTQLELSNAEPCLGALAGAARALLPPEPRRPRRVLELGAGRGELTNRLLELWGNVAELDYVITDISPLLVRAAAQRARARGLRNVSTCVFDVTRPPEEQGVHGPFDAIVGYNVVHVAPSIPRALRALRSLLAPDGWLGLVEVVAPRRWDHLIWGLAPGWWAFADELRRAGPTAEVATWRAALLDAGFAEVAATDAEGADHATLVASGAKPSQAPELSAAPAPERRGAPRLTAVPPQPSSAPAPQLSPTTAGDSSMAAQRVRALWREALGVIGDGEPGAGPASFAALGGDSLTAVHLLARLREQLGAELRLSDVLTAESAEQLVQLVGRTSSRPRASRPASRYLVPLNPDGARPPLFCVAPAAGSPLCYHDLAMALGDAQPVYGLEARGLHDGLLPLTRLEDMAAAHLTALRSLVPRGPYRLAGWSFGAILAHEMARQLEAAGDGVALLACFDAVVPFTAGRPWGATPGVLMRTLWQQMSLLLEIRLPRRFDELAHSAAWFGVRLEPAREGRSFGRTVRELRRVVGNAPRFAEVYNANLRATLRYAPAQISAPTVIFKAEPGHGRNERQRVVEALRPLVRGPIEVVPVAGTHMTMLTPRYVESTAQALRDVLVRYGGQATAVRQPG